MTKRSTIHTTASVLAANALLGLDIRAEYRTSERAQEAQADGVLDWEEGNPHGFYASGDYTPVERRAYTHGHRTGHRKCTCAINVDGQRYTMDNLPDEF